MVVPKAVLAEEQGQVLVILTTKTVLQGGSSHSHQGIYILEHQERFSPESEFGGYFELFHSNFDVPGVDISLFDVDVDSLLLFGFISFAEGIL